MRKCLRCDGQVTDYTFEGVSLCSSLSLSLSLSLSQVGGASDRAVSGDWLRCGGGVTRWLGCGFEGESERVLMDMVAGR